MVRHHRVIERWLSGAADPGEFAVFADAHDPGFELCAPDGRVLGAQDVLAEVRAAHGRAPGLTIDVRDVRVVAEAAGLQVVTYEEWHDGTSGRRATAVLSRGRWLHLQETRLPGGP
ncbi:DUF4440 domain-containing protein [Nonomuraea sp. NN258]|uniref:DUF4440 domain-containing protein n=1 Tax=Nonomuraea antri TaxID=2730852 RepID=UPI001568CB38|nr:DUF4440 domain-containing protein [Nonomuraea antri]NRQ36146.1 DUF4440 domain-containing protein [Nonomuraea antri]